MAYQLKHGTDVGKSARRIARSQTATGLDHLRSVDRRSPDPAAILACRKRIKRVRALLRLIRPSIGDGYRLSDRQYRQAGLLLAELRTSQAHLDVFDRAVRARPDLLPPDGLLTVRVELARRAEAVAMASTGETSPVIDQAIEALTIAEELIDRLDFSGRGWDIVGPGFRRTYQRGATRLTRLDTQQNSQQNSKADRGKKARRSHDPGPASSEALHDIRKQAKYTRFQLRLLRRSAPSMLDPLADRFADLTRALGDARDLALLHDELRAEPAAFGGETVTTVACQLANELRTDLERRALNVAHLVYAEDPEQLAARVNAYWVRWEETGDEEPVGKIEVAASPATTGEIADELDTLSVAQLRLLARECDLPGRSRTQRAELIAMLRAFGVNTRRDTTGA